MFYWGGKWMLGMLINAAEKIAYDQVFTFFIAFKRILAY